MLVSEDVFKSENLDRSESLEVVGVKILDVTEDTVSVCAALYPFLLSCLHILKCESLGDLEDLLAAWLCDAELAVAEVAVEDSSS